jgi:hypothetical protein
MVYLVQLTVYFLLHTVVRSTPLSKPLCFTVGKGRTPPAWRTCSTVRMADGANLANCVLASNNSVASSQSNICWLALRQLTHRGRMSAGGAANALFYL